MVSPQTEAGPGNPESDGRRPSIVLSVYHLSHGSGGALHFQLRVLKPQTGGAGPGEESYEARPIAAGDPFAYVSSLFGQIEKLSSRHAASRRKAVRQLSGIGGTLARELLPPGLSSHLSALAAEANESGGPRPSLYLLSNESWIPWEILRLDAPAGAGEGPYLAEAFALARWRHRPAPAAGLPLRRIGLVIPREEGEGNDQAVHDEEPKLLRQIEGACERFQRVPARYTPLIDELASASFDGWHFSGHGLASGDNPHLWGIQLEAGDQLTPPDLGGRARGLGQARPLVFLNACHTARSRYALTRLAGLAEAFLEAGAGAFLGTHWAVLVEPAQVFAQAFYRSFFAGAPIAEAVRRARLEARREYPEDPTWLAYTLFAHPLAVSAKMPPERTLYHPALLSPAAQKLVAVPQHRWDRDHPPGALLRADYGVVPFHGRDQELEELDGWCRDDAPLRARLYTGPGGMGKTRLALEMCVRLAQEGWRAGFVTRDLPMPPREAAEVLSGQGGPMLLVVDYAETRRDLLVPLVGELLGEKQGPVRLILLARAALDWWEQLQAEREGVGDFFAGPRTSRYSLGPLAFGREQRERSYHLAGSAFAEQLDKTAPQKLPDDLEAEHFERVLLLHMAALAAIDGAHAKGEDGVLDWVLDREGRFWRERAAARGLPPPLVPGIGRAMAAITLGGGVGSEGAAIDAIKGLAFFADEHRSTLAGVAHLLHECYPGNRWIEPVLPDLLAEHLVMRELEKGADELLDLVLGPRAG